MLLGELKENSSVALLISTCLKLYLVGAVWWLIFFVGGLSVGGLSDGWGSCPKFFDGGGVKYFGSSKVSK